MRFCSQIEKDLEALLRCVQEMKQQCTDIIWRSSCLKKIEANGEDFRAELEKDRQIRRLFEKFDMSLDAAFRIRLKRSLDYPLSLDSEMPAPYLFRQVEVQSIAPRIYVKTPPLFNRNRHAIGSGVVDYYSFFAPVVAEKMKALRNELPLFCEKNINILSVYPNGEKKIPDGDNLDSKRIVDAITHELPGGDAATVCSFSIVAVQSDDLPHGAYFTVSPGFARVPDFKENMTDLIKIFGTKKGV